MKRILFALSFFYTTTLAAQTDSLYLFCYFKGNGDGLHYACSEDGFRWKAMFNDSAVLKPAVSKDKLFRDPCIARGADGRWHMVWTVSWADRGIGYASSPDLIHWSNQEFIPVMAGEDSAKNTWAPEITYDAKRKEYVVYWASTVPGRFAQADTSAEGRKWNHRIYYSTTKDFKTWNKARLLYEPGFSVIDAAIVPDGEWYVLFLKNETKQPAQKNIRIAYAKSLTGPYSKPGPSITGNYWAEGPTAIKVNGKWMVYFDKYTEHEYGAVASTDLLNWTDVSDRVEFPKGMRHGTAFAISRKEWEAMQK